MGGWWQGEVRDPQSQVHQVPQMRKWGMGEVWQLREGGGLEGGSAGDTAGGLEEVQEFCGGQGH